MPLDCVPWAGCGSTALTSCRSAAPAQLQHISSWLWQRQAPIQMHTLQRHQNASKCDVCHARRQDAQGAAHHRKQSLTPSRCMTSRPSAKNPRTYGQVRCGGGGSPAANVRPPSASPPSLPSSDAVSGTVGSLDWRSNFMLLHGSKGPLCQ